MKNKMPSKYLENLGIKNINAKLLNNFNSAINSMHFRYFIVGAWNTAFGYFSANALYYTLQNKFHLVLISIFSNILSITMSFLTYKILVFKTRGNWISEYQKFYILYGANAILGTSLLWVLVDLIGTPFWLGQAIILMISIVLLYFGHLKFTFFNVRLTK